MRTDRSRLQREGASPTKAAYLSERPCTTKWPNSYDYPRRGRIVAARRLLSSWPPRLNWKRRLSGVCPDMASTLTERLLSDEDVPD